MTAIPKALRVYIVEDSAIILKLLNAAVESAGAELVGISDNAQQAIRDLPRLQPDLLLLDIALRSGTGFDVLKALQAAGNAAPATKIVLTNYATTAYRDNSFRLGATHFFDKSSEGSRAMELISKMAANRQPPKVKARKPVAREPDNPH